MIHEGNWEEEICSLVGLIESRVLKISANRRVLIRDLSLRDSKKGYDL